MTRLLKTVSIFILLAVGLKAQTHIVDTLYAPTDTPPTSTVSGSYTVTSQTFLVGGNTVTKISKTTPIVAGVIDITLQPNDTVTSVGSYYNVNYTLNNSDGSQTNTNEHWLVPTSTSTLTLANVRIAPISNTPSSPTRILPSQVLLPSGDIITGSASGVGTVVSASSIVKAPPVPGTVAPLTLTALCFTAPATFTGSGLNDFTFPFPNCSDNTSTSYIVAIDGINVAGSFNYNPDPTFQQPMADWTTDEVGLMVVATGNATYTSGVGSGNGGWCGTTSCDEFFLNVNNAATVVSGTAYQFSYTVSASSGTGNLTCSIVTNPNASFPYTGFLVGLNLSVGAHVVNFVYVGPTSIKSFAPDVACIHTGTSSVQFTNVSLFAVSDTIKWSQNGGAYTSGVPITSGQHVIGGTAIEFASPAGHALANQWAWGDTVTTYNAPDTSGGINLQWPPYYGSGSAVTTTTVGTTSPGTSVVVASVSSFYPGQGIYIANAGPTSGIAGTLTYASGGTATGTGVVTLNAINGSGFNAIANLTVNSNTLSGNLTIVSPGLGYTSGAGLPTNWTCIGNVGTTCSGTVVTTGGTLVSTPYTGVIQSVSANTNTIALKTATSTAVAQGALVQHDDTTAENTAIAWITNTNSGGRIFHPCGTWNFNGPMLDPTNQNAMVPVPVFPYQGTTPSVPIELSGEIAPGAPQATNGCTIFQTISTGGNWLSGINTSQGFSPTLPLSLFFTGVNLSMKNITFKVPSNPSITVINANGIAGFEGASLLLTNGLLWGGQPNSVNPTNPNGQGILLPGQSNSNMSVLRDSRIGGFYTGVVADEHALLDNIEVIGNAVGLQLGNFSDPGSNESHPVAGTTVGVFNNGIGILGAAIQPISIQTLEVENDTSSSPTATFVCSDPRNLLYGTINYYNAPETGRTGTPFANGCTGITFAPLDNSFCKGTSVTLNCNSANRGALIIGVGAATTTVNTSAIGATSQVMPVFDSSLGSLLSVTCATTPVLVSVSARTPGTSFALSIPVASDAQISCFRWSILP